jgi:1-acyl-sn-glycerol-3-phosphate acyltransferase
MTLRRRRLLYQSIHSTVGYSTSSRVYSGPDRKGLPGPTLSANTIDFNGRTGYVRTAVEAGVPIVPTVSIGGQETQLFLTRGNWLARKLGLTKARMDILPVSFGFPFGLSVIFPPNLPLPAKVVTEVLEPIDVTARFGDDPDVAEVDAHVREVMEAALKRLAGQRRIPILG